MKYGSSERKKHAITERITLKLSLLSLLFDLWNLYCLGRFPENTANRWRRTKFTICRIIMPFDRNYVETGNVFLIMFARNVSYQRRAHFERRPEDSNARDPSFSISVAILCVLGPVEHCLRGFTLFYGRRKNSFTKHNITMRPESCANFETRTYYTCVSNSGNDSRN